MFILLAGLMTGLFLGTWAEGAFSASLLNASVAAAIAAILKTLERK